MLIRTCLL